MRLILASVVFACVAIVLARDASAATVRAGVSTRETYVGLPVTLQIQVRDATTSEPPTLPAVDGLKFTSLGTPSRSTQTTIINGNVSSSSSVTYAYEITPQRAGSFHIPPIAVAADGRVEQTPGFDLVASKSETGDLLFVEITGKEKQIYVGQSLDLTLKIWVRPYRDKQHNITLSEADMWQLLAQRTAFGPFEEQVRQLEANQQRPAGREVLRKDQDGVEHSYYLYEIDATIYPKKPGHIDASNVNVVVQYPTAIGQARDPFLSFFGDGAFPGGRGGMFDESMFSAFGPRLAVESVRPIVADAKVEPIDVLEIPTAGRPADYRGAVGRYQIITEASSSSVKAGDPIELLIGIAGTGPMELVQAPPLAELPALSADFKVPSEPLAGFVQGDRKVFSTTIRPRKEGITEIPAIPFSYFDPNAKKFVTVQSKPISIHVEAADTLALADVVGRSHAATAKPASARAASVGEAARRQAIFTGDEVLLSQSPPAMISGWALALLALPPLTVLGLFVLRSGSGWGAIAGRFGSRLRKCRVQIERAEQPAEVAKVLRGYFATQLRIGGSRADATTIVGALRRAGYRQLAVRCERMLDQCEVRGHASFVGSPLGELKREAIELVEALETESRRPRPTPAVRRRAVSASLGTIVVASLLVISGNTCFAAEVTPLDNSLSMEQRQTLLADAGARYELALGAAARDSAEAKQGFADAAEKYQLLANAGIRNGWLYFNLANAYLESGDAARAVANYRRALRLDPTNGDARRNLAYAEGLLPAPAASAHRADRSLFDYASLANAWLNRLVRPQAVLVAAIGAWLVFWAVIAARLLAWRTAWKSTASVALLISVVAASSYALSCQSASEAMAIIVSPAATLRTGDGEQFAVVADGELQAGQTVAPLKHRGEWTQVRTDVGQIGWLPQGAVEIL